MNRKKLLCAAIVVFATAFASLSASAQDYFYVIVGTFREEANAQKWAELAKKYDLHAEYAALDKEYYNYVFTYQSETFKEARAEYERIKDLPDFPDTWILKAGPIPGNQSTVINESEKNPVVRPQRDPNEQIAQNQEEPREEPEVIDTTDPVTNLEQAVDMGIIPPMQLGKYMPEGPATASIDNSPAYMPEFRHLEIPGVRVNDDPSAIEPDLGPVREGYSMYKLYFNTVNGRNLEDVETEVEVINIFEANLITTVPSHTLTGLQLRHDWDKQVMLVCNPVGYRRMEHTLDVEDPFADNIYNYVKRNGDSIIVDFNLMRLRKGDIDVLFNVYFYNDAAIMRPQSQYEVDQVLSLLQENPTMRLKIHGHTNGNAFGKIVKRAEDSDEYFAVNASSVETMGSAKELSYQRALAIKDYLVKEGIEPDRMEVEGWGGKRPIYDEDSDLAKKNVRVEIEVLEE